MSIDACEAWFAEALRRLSPPIVGFGVGGSRGWGVGDAVSDLDLFAVVDGCDAVTFAVNDLAALVPPGLMSVGQTRTVRAHGVAVSFLCSPPLKVEVFVTPLGAVDSWLSPSTIQPMYDPHGHLAAAIRADPRRRARSIDDALHDLASDLFHTRKCAVRKSYGAMPFVLTAVCLSAARVTALRAGESLDSSKVAEWWTQTEPRLAAGLWSAVQGCSVAVHAAIARGVSERAIDGLSNDVPVVTLIRGLLDEFEKLEG